MLQNVLMILHGVVAFGIIILVLLQQGKGADAGAAFGGGASSQSVFGSQGSSSFLTRTTAVLGAVFFITSLTLAYLAGASQKEVSITDNLDLPIERAAPSDIPAMPSNENEVKKTVSDMPDIPSDPDVVPEGNLP
ncbi:Protein translocase membrane subunit SecG [hydrothermal vent metagenome]|uniref:Protein translocase membrane subunit SecG n=1 Tax=hydrothermal vent metagenome TaxID=652676 RepID=A0A3B0ZIX3_9ZZZZ